MRTSLVFAVIAMIAGCSRKGAVTEAEASPPREARQGAPAKDREALKKKLTPLQFEVTQDSGTEPPFRNEYWDNKVPGIYVDVVSGEPLFSSIDKFDSGTGWPSFTRPLEEANIVGTSSHGVPVSGTEVRSKQADSHLGHVFDDGPPPTRIRYCMNSAALRFVPADKLQEAGYGQYAHLFGKDGKAAAKVTR